MASLCTIQSEIIDKMIQGKQRADTMKKLKMGVKLDEYDEQYFHQATCEDFDGRSKPASLYHSDGVNGCSTV